MFIQPAERFGIEYDMFCKHGQLYNFFVEHNQNIRKGGWFPRFEDFKSNLVPSDLFIDYISSYLNWFNTEDPKKEGLAVGNDEKLQYVPASQNIECFYNQLKKYDYDIKFSVRPGLWRKSLKFVEQLYAVEFSKSEKLTYEELGVYVYSRDVDEKSCGNVLRKEGYSDKGELLLNKELLELFIKSMSQSYCGMTFWSLFLKDEMRDAVKARLNNSRLFECSSGLLTFLTMIYVVKLQQEVLKSYKDKPIVSALSRFGGEWDEFIRRMGTENIAATDGDKWDKNIRPEFVVDFFNVLSRYVCKDNTDYIVWANILREHIIRYSIGPDNQVYRITTGFPSGSFVTMLFNSFHHCRLFAYIMLCKSQDFKLEYSYTDYLGMKFCVVGDDNYWRTSIFDRDYYIKTVKSMFNSSYIEGSTVYELPFLGSKTVYVDGFYIPVLDEIKQFCSAFFRHKDTDVVGVYSKVASLALNICFSQANVMCLDGKIRTYFELLWGFKDYLESLYPDLKFFENCWFNRVRAFKQYTCPDTLELSSDFVLECSPLNGSGDPFCSELGRNKQRKMKKKNSNMKKNSNKQLSGKEIVALGVANSLPRRQQKRKVPNSVRVAQSIGEKTAMETLRYDNPKALNAMVNKKIKNFRLTKVGKKYLRALVNPIAASDDGEDIKYPDKFAGLSFSWTSKIVLKNLPYVTDYSSISGPSVIGDLKDGAINWYVQPTLVSPLKTLEVVTVGSQASFFAQVNEQTEFRGLKAIASGVRSSSDIHGALVLTPEIQQIVANYNLAGDFTGITGDPTSLTYPYRYVTSSGVQHFGYPLVSEAIQVCFTNDTKPVGSDTVVCRISDAAGNILITQTQAIVAGLNTIPLNSGVAAQVGKLPGGRLEIFTDGAIYKISNINVKATLSPAYKAMIYTGHDILNFDSLYSDLDRYRVVAMSGLMSNVSSVLNLNGTTSGLLMRGGEPPLYNDIADSGRLGEFDGCYNGKLAEGQYTWWHPFDTKDMEFQDLDGDSWLRPCIVNSSSFTPGTLNNQFQLVVGICYEATTHSQSRKSHKSPVELRAIVAADRMVSELGCCWSTSNDAHEEILKFLKLPLELSNYGVDSILEKFDKLPVSWQSALPFLMRVL